MTPSRHELRVGLVLVALGGAAALGHQVLWTRRLTDLIGTGVESCARVVECFFLGIALGSAAAAWLAPKLWRPWRAVGYAELGAAILCLPVLFLPHWTGWIWPVLGPERLAGWPGFMLKTLLSFLVVTPPVILMGMTLPLVMQAVGEPGRARLNRGPWLYAAHTVGGALGLTLVVGLALQVAGVGGAILSMMGINLIVAGVCLTWDWRRQRVEDANLSLPTLGNETGGAPRPDLSLSLAFLTGAGFMAFEALGLELLNLKMLLSLFTPAAVLWCVVWLLGCAATVAPWLARRCGGVSGVLPVLLAGAGLMTAATPVFFLGVTAGQSGTVIHGSGIGRSLLRLAGVTGVSLGPAVILAGLVFPLLLVDDDPAGSGPRGWRLGRLLAVNGLGGMIGTEFALRVLLPVFGVHGALGMVGGFYSLTSIVVLLILRQTSLLRWAFLLALAAGTVWLLSGTLQRLPIFLRTGTFQIVEVRSAAEGSLAVVERPDLGRAMFLDNLYLLGSTKAGPDLERQAHLPLLLHPSPQRVGFAGLGTGITASGALRHQAVASIRIVELSGLVTGAAARHFRAFNQGICDHPKARVYIEDAGPYFASARERFDVIVGDLFIPWRPGEARLCSLEQFQASRNALAPGGVFCQWLAMSQLTEQDFRTIVATFQHVFGTAHLFRSHFKTGTAPLALVGFKGSQLDWNTVERRCAAERESGGLRDPVCRHPQGVAMVYLGSCEMEGVPENQLNTLGNLRVELSASVHVLSGSPSDYFHGDSDRWLTFLERQVRRIEQDREMPEALQRFPGLGWLVTRWEIAAELGDPSAPALRKTLVDELFDPILADSAADGSLWAGHTLF
jgi:spermidine synthase